jgi:hypothetical protein
MCITSEKHDERTHRGSRKRYDRTHHGSAKTRRMNVPWPQRARRKCAKRTQPPQTRAPRKCAERTQCSSRRPRGGTRQNEAISRNPLVRTHALPVGSDDGSFLRNEAITDSWGPRHRPRPPTKRPNEPNGPTMGHGRNAPNEPTEDCGSITNGSRRRAGKTRRTNPPKFGRVPRTYPKPVRENGTNEPTRRSARVRKRANRTVPPSEA